NPSTKLSSIKKHLTKQVLSLYGCNLGRLLQWQVLKFIQFFAAIAARYKNLFNSDDDFFISGFRKCFKKLFIRLARAIIFNTSNLILVFIVLFIRKQLLPKTHRAFIQQPNIE